MHWEEGNHSKSPSTYRNLISSHRRAFSCSDMNSLWHATGNESRKNSQFAFSIVSNVLCEIFKQGGVSAPPKIRVTSIRQSTMSSVFSNTGWSFVYQCVTGRRIFLGLRVRKKGIEIVLYMRKPIISCQY